jgi:hypothetical protein
MTAFCACPAASLLMPVFSETNFTKSCLFISFLL